MWKLPAVALAALVAGCAATSGSPEVQCRYFAGNEGFEWLRDIKSAPVSGGTAVTMDLKDGLARRFSATCISGEGKTRWAEPLPSNVVRDVPGRTSY